MSIVEAEVAPHGLDPNSTPGSKRSRAKCSSCRTLQWAATHSHPFLVRIHGEPRLVQENEYAAKNLSIPGYTMDLEREIVGSSQYINSRLAPKDKPVTLLQWSGDTAPNAKALEITARAGLYNINGGDHVHQPHQPIAHGHWCAGHRQARLLAGVRARITNENIYTNLDGAVLWFRARY